MRQYTLLLLLSITPSICLYGMDQLPSKLPSRFDSFNKARNGNKDFLEKVFNSKDLPNSTFLLDDQKTAFLLTDKNQFASSPSQYQEFVQKIQSMIINLFQQSPIDPLPKIIIDENNIQKIQNKLSAYQGQLKALETSFTWKNISDLQDEFNETMNTLIGYMPDKKITEHVDFFGQLYSLFLRYRNTQKTISEINKIINESSAEEAKKEIEAIKKRFPHNKLAEKVISSAQKKIKQQSTDLKEELIREHTLKNKLTRCKSQLLLEDYEVLEKQFFSFSSFIGYLRLLRTNPSRSPLSGYSSSQISAMINKYYPENGDQTTVSNRKNLLKTLQEERAYANPSTPEERREWLETPLRVNKFKELKATQKKNITQSPRAIINSDHRPQTNTSSFMQAALSFWYSLSSWWQKQVPPQEKSKTIYKEFH